MILNQLTSESHWALPPSYCRLQGLVCDSESQNDFQFFRKTVPGIEDVRAMSSFYQLTPQPAIFLGF